MKPDYIVKWTKYWYGLFSHKKITNLWKGMLEIRIDEDDLEAINFLSKGDYYDK
jgi:hypothetical protein